MNPSGAAQLVRIFTALLTVLLSLLSAEVVLRIYGHFTPIFIFYDSSYNRFRGKPFADDWGFKLNSAGFKDTEFTEKAPGVYRILGVGDSFAFGTVPYEYNYLTLIESQLRAEGWNAEVLNMGIPRTGPSDYASLLVHEGLDLRPDMILLSFFVGNDFVESDESLRKRKWYSHSYAMSLLHYLVAIRPHYEGRQYHRKPAYCDDCPIIKPGRFLQIERDLSFIYLNGNELFERLMQDAVGHLEQIQEICKKRDFALVVVLIPDVLQIDQELQARVRRRYFSHLREDEWNTALPNVRLSEQLARRGIDHIDLYERFAAHSGQRLYRPRDTHWNIAGNQLAADLIQEHLRSYLENDP